jgi:riboflavin synthase
MSRAASKSLGGLPRACAIAALPASSPEPDARVGGRQLLSTKSLLSGDTIHCSVARMFTGLIEELGNVLWIRATDRGTQLQIAAPKIAEHIKGGDSVAVNGCCLTVTMHRAEQITFDLLDETLRRTNLKHLRRDSPVNLEQPITAEDPLGGHFVQGHIDCCAPIVAFEPLGGDYRLEVKLPMEFAHYVATKGSIAVNGISLTVADVLPESFAAWVIPLTKRATNLQTAQPGEFVNLEFDILAKYVERMSSAYRAGD